MALSIYTDVIVDKVYGYESFGTVYGVKVLQRTFIDALSDYRFIVQQGKALSGEDFVPYGDGKNLSAMSQKDIKDEYGKLYTKDETFVKGDLIEATAGDGTRMLFVFETKDVVHRLTKGGSFYSVQSWASLKTYQAEFPDMKVMTTQTYSKRKFSQL